MSQRDTMKYMAKETDYLQIRIDSEIKRKLQALAESRGVSAAALIIMAVTEAYPELRNDSQAIEPQAEAGSALARALHKVNHPVK